MLVRHALRNGIMPMITVLGINLAFLIGNTVVVEKVFALPGIGAMIYDGITQRDFAVVQGVTLVLALLVVFVNVVIDVTYLVPRSARELRLMAAIAASEAVPAREIARRRTFRNRWYRTPVLRGRRDDPPPAHRWRASQRRWITPLRPERPGPPAHLRAPVGRALARHRRARAATCSPA